MQGGTFRSAVAPKRGAAGVRDIKREELSSSITSSVPSTDSNASNPRVRLSKLARE